jgi:PPM family protein phosphatase
MLLRKRPKPKIASSAPLPVSGTMLTHPGCVRELNEDVVAYVLPTEAERAASRGAIALVADGMGGHAAGEVASRIAADTVLRLYYQLESSPPKVLAACFKAANRLIRERSRADATCAGMGTTCTVLALNCGTAFLAHIGDSRAYLLRDGRLQQISEDHSLVAQLVREGSLTEEEASRSPERNVILRALGTEPSIKPSISPKGFPLQPGDAFVLCSDGLSDLVNNETIAGTVARLAPFEACQALVDAALAGGGADNVSVGVFVVGSTREQEMPEAPRTTRPIKLPGAAP